MRRTGRAARSVAVLFLVVGALGWGGCNGSDTVSGRAFTYQERVYGVSCLRVDVDSLGRRIGPVQFEDRRLVISEVNGVEASQALATQFNECHFANGGEEWVLGLPAGSDAQDFSHLVEETESSTIRN